MKTWESFSLDEKAQKLVLDAIKRNPETFNQVYSMRTNVIYGLERFWGEHLRFFQSVAKKLEKKERNELKDKDKLELDKGIYWCETWDKLVDAMEKADIKNLPHSFQPEKLKDADVQSEIDKIWNMDEDERRIVQAVLTQLCDCMVWWSQRFKPDRKEVRNLV